VLTNEAAFDRQTVDLFLESLDTIHAAIGGEEIGDIPADVLEGLVNRISAGAVVDSGGPLAEAEAELESAGTGDVDPTTLLPRGFLPVFLRGQAQTNTVVKLSESLFDQITDYRSSLGMEVRVQVPIINVPFRLIFAYNPNARQNQVIQGFPFFFNEKKRVIRFSVGRTF